jgi:hypothetical protein
VFSEGALWPILVVLVKGKNEFLSNKALKNYKNIKGFFFFNIWPKILKIL